MSGMAGLYRELSEQVRDPKRETRLAQVRELAGAAQMYDLTIRRLRGELDGTQARQMARMREQYSQVF